MKTDQFKQLEGVEVYVSGNDTPNYEITWGDKPKKTVSVQKNGLESKVDPLVNPKEFYYQTMAEKFRDETYVKQVIHKTLQDAIWDLVIMPGNYGKNKETYMSHLDLCKQGILSLGNGADLVLSAGISLIITSLDSITQNVIVDRSNLEKRLCSMAKMGDQITQDVLYEQVPKYPNNAVIPNFCSYSTTVEDYLNKTIALRNSKKPSEIKQILDAGKNDPHAELKRLIKLHDQMYFARTGKHQKDQPDDKYAHLRHVFEE